MINIETLGAFHSTKNTEISGPKLNGTVKIPRKVFENLGIRFECTLGAFHSTKISGNPGLKLNGTDISRKFLSKISVHLSRLYFFLEIWKFRKFPVPFGIFTRYETAPVPLAVKSYKMAASLASRHYTGCKIMCHCSSLFLIAYSPRSDLIFWKIVDWSFRTS